MSAAVEQVLDRRGRQSSRRPVAFSLGAALFVHALALTAALLLPHLSPPPEPIQFVPVTILPAQALGVPRPAPPRPAAPAPPAPETAAPKPPETREPEPEPPPREEAPVLPEPKPTPERREPKPEPRAARPEPAPAKPLPRPSQSPAPPSQAAPTETGDQAGRRGAATGTPLGTTAFGARLPGIDPDFTYGYYIDRLLSAIDGNWVRPRVDGSVRTIVAFRIHRDGSLTDLTVKESSGYNAFDLAALRAVQNAAPFPPLPRGYRNDSLNVNLIVR